MASSARGGIIRPSLHMRNIITVRATPVEEESILVAQRKNRPVSPHLEIYEKQLTAVLSALHRITGVGLAAGFLVVTSSYAVGLVDTASLVTFFAGLPVAAKVAFKAVAGVPFAFHAWNGVRHMVWDSGHEANIKGVYKTGYAVLGLTAVSALALLFACARPPRIHRHPTSLPAPGVRLHRAAESLDGPVPARSTRHGFQPSICSSPIHIFYIYIFLFIILFLSACHGRLQPPS